MMSKENRENFFHLQIFWGWQNPFCNAFKAGSLDNCVNFISSLKTEKQKFFSEKITRWYPSRLNLEVDNSISFTQIDMFLSVF